jgi:hypothetical protein
MNITEIIVALSLAIIHPYFFDTITKLMLNYDQIMHKCSFSNSTEYERCIKLNEPEMKKVALKNHVILMVIALTSILLSIIIQGKSTKFGLGIGGIILLSMTLTSYWKNYNEKERVIISGISLLIVLFASYKLY